jgi:hypothetical protein
MQQEQGRGVDRACRHRVDRRAGHGYLLVLDIDRGGCRRSWPYWFID